MDYPESDGLTVRDREWLRLIAEAIREEFSGLTDHAEDIAKFVEDWKP